jgi:hypothetical protein
MLCMQWEILHHRSSVCYGCCVCVLVAMATKKRPAPQKNGVAMQIKYLMCVCVCVWCMYASYNMCVSNVD